MTSNKFWRFVGVLIIAISVIAVAYTSIMAVTYGLGYVDGLLSRPTPVPIVRECINRPRVLDEIDDLFFRNVNLLDTNDVDFEGYSVRRPSGSQFTEEEKTNMLVVSVYFQAQKPGTGKYLKGRYDVYFENDVACKVEFTRLEW